MGYNPILNTINNETNRKNNRTTSRNTYYNGGYWKVSINSPGISMSISHYLINPQLPTRLKRMVIFTLK